MQIAITYNKEMVLYIFAQVHFCGCFIRID